MTLTEAIEVLREMLGCGQDLLLPREMDALTRVLEFVEAPRTDTTTELPYAASMDAAIAETSAALRASQATAGHREDPFDPLAQGFDPLAHEQVR